MSQDAQNMANYNPWHDAATTSMPMETEDAKVIFNSSRRFLGPFRALMNQEDPFAGVNVDADEVDARQVGGLVNVSSKYTSANREPLLHERIQRLLSTSSPNEPDIFYKLSKGGLKGRAIIVNITSFTGDEQSREGSNRDAVNMMTSLESLGFKVEVFENLKSREFYQLLYNLTLDPKKVNANVDVFAMVILSHGTQNREEHDVIMSSDSEEILFKYITSQFAANIAKTLAGKPKLFFVQACRGDKTDPGREVAADSADGTADGRSKIAMRVQSDGVDEPDALFFRTITIPAEADIFVAYSTPPGYYSWRSPESGSYFMQLLAYRLYQNGNLQNLDLSTIITLVSHDLVNFRSNVPQREGMHKKKQVPWISSTLTKKLKFKP